MTSENMKLWPEYQKALLEKSDTVYFKSDFRFLREHKGWRPGEMHLFLGTYGGGKSTLVRSMIFNTLLRNPDKKIMLYLSEETEDEFYTELARFGITDTAIYERLILIAEKEPGFDLERPIQAHIEDHTPDLLVFDNVTTSYLYTSKRFHEQVLFSNKLKEICSSFDIPFVLIAHTGKQVTKNMSRLIDANDIRGCSELVNLAQFFYVLQSFESQDAVYSTLRITKSRTQDIKYKLFGFDYSPDSRVYTGDYVMKFEMFKEIFKDSDKL